MQKTKTAIHLVTIISLISMVISGNGAFAVGPTDAFVSNVINTPDKSMMTEVRIGESVFNLPPANQRGQSPFMPITPGTYDIIVAPHDGYKISKAKCVFQDPKGSWIKIGNWNNGDNKITGVALAKAVAHKCYWTFERVAPS